jgi:ribosome recycling factor
MTTEPTEDQSKITLYISILMPQDRTEMEKIVHRSAAQSKERISRVLAGIAPPEDP